MPFSQTDSHSFKFQNAFGPFAQGADLPLAGVLPVETVERLCVKHAVKFGTSARSFWTPALTLWAFVWQVLSADPSCRQAVAQVVLAFSLSGQPEELDTGAYCRARAKLPAAFVRDLTEELGQGMEAAALPGWRWRGRKVTLIDGSTSRLPDTPENQRAFPQPKSQKPGLGSPMIRWVALIGLATAALQGLAYGPCVGKETGEVALFRELLRHLVAGEVVVADRLYCSYFLIALLRRHGVDVVFRLHQRRSYDFRRGYYIGPGDHMVVWHKPERPAWLDEELYESLPAVLTMREVRYEVNEPGFRVKQVVLATTLLDGAEYPADMLADLYHERWHAELDIRSLKCALGLDQLRCLTPFMVEKEIWANCLSYNLVRKVASQAAVAAKRNPREISFTATKQAVLGSWPKLTMATGEDYVVAATRLLRVLRKQRVGNRPNRCEPRATKNRPKAQKLMTEPRATARAKLMGNKGPKSQK
jgi:putative transposase